MRTAHTHRNGPRAARAQWVAEQFEDRRLLSAFDVLVFSRTQAFRHDSIPAGINAIRALGMANDFAVVATEDPTAFNDANLAQFEAVVFLCTTGDVLDDTQQAAFQRYIEAGHGYVGVHSAADTEYAWPWYGGLVGAYFSSHPAIQQATIKVADRSFPATAGVPERWVRTDEWYNYQLNPRGNVHVLMTLDENTYTGGTMGFDHPIAWAQNYDGGRSFYTGLGHTFAGYSEPLMREHLLGGIQFAAGVAPTADAGATVSRSFQKVVLDPDTNNPMQLDVAPDGRVFYVERGGAIKVWNPATSGTSLVGTIPVFTGAEDGLLGLALDPNFSTNRQLFVFYAAPSPSEQHVSRFTLTPGGSLDTASEKILLRIPVQRTHSNHSAGALGFGPGGVLYVSTGDNTNPFESDGFDPIDERAGRSDWDAQKSAGNTNDLRGKILRIHPEPDGTYTIPTGNLFAPGTAQTRPEIYVMGDRNPFRFSVDSETGYLYWGEVGPDSGVDSATRGPRGYDEFNQARAAGNFGWPYLIADNKSYIDYNFATGVSGAPFPASGPINNSPNNTGLQQLPPTQPAWMWYAYNNSTEWPELNPLPGGPNGRTAMGGPVYHYNTAGADPRRLPAYYDDTLFIYEWSRNWIKEVKVDAAGNVLKVNPFAPNLTWKRPMDMKIGPDGVMYVLEWGSGFGGDNADSQLVRVDYNRSFLPPVAAFTVDRDSGALPLAVQFNSAATTPGDRGPLTYAWDFNNDGTVDSTAANPAFIYTQPGNFTARLTVTDTAGITSVATRSIAAGNTRPQVTIGLPPDGGFFSWGQYLPYATSVVDAEDGGTAAGTIDGASIVVQPLLGHNDHAHPLLQYPGPAGTFPTEAGHGTDADNIFMLVQASYTDHGAPGVQPLTGTSIVRLRPRHQQAEFFSSASAILLADSGDADGSLAVAGIEDLDYIAFDPVNLQNIDLLRFRVSAITSVGTIEVHTDAPAGPLLGSVNVPTTGATTWTTVSLPVTNPGGTHALYVVFRIAPTANAGLRLNWIEFDRAGNTAPAAAGNAYSLPAGTRLDVPAPQGVLSNDTDGQNDLLFAVVGTPPAHGTLRLNPDGSFVYVPEAGFAGADGFTYFAHDGVFPSAPVTVSLDITVPQVTDVFVASSRWRSAFRMYLASHGLGSVFGFRVSDAQQLRTLPWAGLDQVSVRFSEPVLADSGDLAVGGVRVGDYGAATGFTYSAASRTAMWTLGRAIDADAVTLRVSAGAGGVTNAAGAAGLDGEWAGPGADTFPSGNGLPGGDFAFALRVLPGDVDASSRVDVYDTLAARARVGSSTTSATGLYSAPHDYNGDGLIDAFDMVSVRARQGSTLPATAAPPLFSDQALAGARLRARDELAALLR